MKIVINNCYGGFSLSDEALQELNAKELNVKNYYDQYSISRSDPNLIAVVEKLGPAANGRYSKLKIVEIPDNVEWQIEDYDGAEWVAEKHRTWS